MAALDTAFASHAALTFAHIISATAFVLVAPLVIFRAAKSGLWERLLFPLGAVVGVTAYAMSIPAFGGWVERSAVLFFNSVFLFSMARAYGTHEPASLSRKCDGSLERLEFSWVSRRLAR